MFRRIFSVVVLLLVLALILCTGCKKEELPEPAAVTIVTDKMTVHEFSGDVKQSIAVISGSARNDSSETLQSPSIEGYFYDKNGQLLGFASATTGSLAPGAIWNFTIEFQSPDAWKTVTYELSFSGDNQP